MSAWNQVIYGDCRSVSDTLSSFLSGRNSPREPKEEIVYSCGYDPSLFVDQERVNRYICAICQHVVKDATDIGCGNKHIFCSNCFSIYNDLNRKDNDNNFVLYGVGNEDWNTYNDPRIWNPNNIQTKYMKCPLCCEAITESFVQHVARIDEIICNELIVQCPLSLDMDETSNDCCDWNGKLCELDQHQTTNCQYQSIQCALCSYESPLKSMQNHINTYHPTHTDHCIL
eukprot:204692_1